MHKLVRLTVTDSDVNCSSRVEAFDPRDVKRVRPGRPWSPNVGCTVQISDREHHVLETVDQAADLVDAALAGE